MPRKPNPPDHRDSEIARLRNALYFTRHALIGLMPDQAKEILGAAIYCESFEMLHKWERWAVHKLIALAHIEESTAPPGWHEPARAMCPLCRSGALPYGEGFSIPVGLTRHLQGTHRTYPCPVYKAAFEDQRDTLRQQEQLGPRAPRPLFTSVAPWDMPKPQPLAAPSAQVFPFERTRE